MRGRVRADRAAAASAGRRDVRRRPGPGRRSGGRARRARGRAGRRRRRRENGWPGRATTRAPGPMPVQRRRAASAACGRRGSRRPRPAPRGRPRPVSIVHTSPTSASRPVASTIRPIRSTTRPWRRCEVGLARAARERRASTRARSCRTSRSQLQCCDDLARARELGLDAGVDVALRRAHDAPPRPTRRSAWTSQCSMPPSAPRSPSIASRTSSRSSGLTRTRDPLALDDAAQRAAHDVDDALGLDRERARERPSRRARAPSSTASRSSRSAATRRVARRRAGGGLGQRGERRLERRVRLGVPGGEALGLRRRARCSRGSARPRRGRLDSTSAASSARPPAAPEARAPRSA